MSDDTAFEGRLRADSVGVALAVREPSSLVEVHDLCGSIEAWAEQTESVAELRDAGNKLAAIDEYLSRTSTEGRGRVAAAQRRLEARIGEVIGKAEETNGRPLPREEKVLSPKQRHEFRQMAEHADVVEQVIADSTDAAPASRRKVTEAIREQAPKPRRSPLADDARNAGWQFRKAVERLERIAEDDRFASNREQVAAEIRGHLLYAQEVCQDLLNQLSKEPS